MILTPHQESFAQLRQRIVVDGNDRVAWLKARARGITATDVAKLTSAKSIQSAAESKLFGSGFSGNAYTEHGKAREPHIAAWVRGEYAILPSNALYRSGGDARHLATPDGIAVRESGSIELSEIKTTNKSWRSIPRNYLRQVWWQQYVLGADRTLVVWEQHENFVPIGEPLCQWVDRDDNEIHKLVTLANELIATLIERTSR
ncbi:YqaJ viral recombinase family protein [Lysinibacter cavernae]|uniref:YqaJ viral recombinase family protein n=1 Tax=Lysinibacter cavernae TaxID=1640652 RepID=UPI003607F5D6